MNHELPDVQAGFRKGRATKLPTFTGSWKKQESSRKTSISALLTMPKPLIVWITINCGKFWERWEYRPPDLPLEKPVCRSGSNTMNKASGGDGIPVELFQILKDDAVKVLHSICQKIWKTQQWPQDWKRSVFIPIPKKDNRFHSNPKERQCQNMLKLLHNCSHLTH